MGLNKQGDIAGGYHKPDLELLKLGQSREGIVKY
jgi:hypothetical protein